MTTSFFILLLSLLGHTVSPKPTGTSIAVVEYFTSEGCSGCPRADHLLGRLLEEDMGENVFFLSFHVDHFDTATWQDPYSNPLFSARQRGYTHTLGAALFTPQMVINGTDLRVGSREHEVRDAIRQALSQPASYTIEATAQHSDQRTASIAYTLPPDARNAVVNIALIETNRPRQSPPYQLDGRTLVHENVVRGFQTVWAQPGQHTFTLLLPSDLNASAASIIVYVQHAADMRVLGATHAALR